MADQLHPSPELTKHRLEALRAAARGPLYRVHNGYRPRGGSLFRLDTIKPLISAGLLISSTAAGKAAAIITPKGRAHVEAKRPRKAA
ncbi:hypothetical protein [Kaistia sp. MMO-174]|uniref:hypothetical protein n=1 Tax=Kaistia sp. MMO-174 TaxID=3081256 RepID=UPI003017BB53